MSLRSLLGTWEPRWPNSTEGTASGCIASECRCQALFLGKPENLGVALAKGFEGLPDQHAVEYLFNAVRLRRHIDVFDHQQRTRRRPLADVGRHATSDHVQVGADAGLLSVEAPRCTP